MDTTLNYPIKKMHAFSDQAKKDAQDAISENDSAWDQYQAKSFDYPSYMQDDLILVLSSYVRHLDDSFAWQSSMGESIRQAADQMQITDNGISKTLKDTIFSYTFASPGDAPHGKEWAGFSTTSEQSA